MFIDFNKAVDDRGFIKLIDKSGKNLVSMTYRMRYCNFPRYIYIYRYIHLNMKISVDILNVEKNYYSFQILIF